MKGGEPFNMVSLNHWFKKLLIRLGANPSYNLSPHQLRHIFVGERRSAGAVSGPCEDVAALMMGHGLKQWDIYESRWWDRRVEECVTDMVGWRQALLQQTAESDDEVCIGLEDYSDND